MTDIRRVEKAAGIRRFIPILSWLPRYDRSWLSVDIIAGLTLWGLVVPEAMAYAGIAGLPPQAGLYTLVASLLIYALLGSSRHLVVQGTSATAALLASSVGAALVATASATASDPQTYQAYASAFVLVTGVVFLAAGLARLGFITQFLSKPVMDGFVLGLAVFVAVGQLNKLFGVPKPEGNTVEKLIGIVRELPEANWIAFIVGAIALAVLFLLPRWNRKLPAGLVVLFGAIILSSALNLEGAYGVEVVGTLPQGLPTISLPNDVTAARYRLLVAHSRSCLATAAPPRSDLIAMPFDVVDSIGDIMPDESLPELTKAPVPVQTHILRLEERIAQGKALRDVASRKAQKEWKPPANRADPVDLLVESSKGRVEELLPIRYGRMMASPFSFYRGAAAIMAYDLAQTPSTGLTVLADGDCHLMNFGGFATAERQVIFDLNDFDEASFAPCLLYTSPSPRD